VIFVPITLAGLILMVTKYGGIRRTLRRAATRQAEDAG
jgi:hypothetical protein